MKFSEAWLREWVNPDVSTEELADQLSMAGLEVDSVEPVAPAFTGVVVGEVLSIEAHPDATQPKREQACFVLKVDHPQLYHKSEYLRWPCIPRSTHGNGAADVHQVRNTFL